MVKELTKVNVFNMDGKEVDSVDIPVFQIDEGAVRQFVSDVAILYEANRKKRMGHAKTRSEVSHSTQKLYRQKGTGRARAGMSSSPVRVGGGVAFPPRHRVVKKKIGKKVRDKALALGLILKFVKNKFKVIDSGEREDVKAKAISRFLSAMKLKSSLFVVDKDNRSFHLSARNIPRTEVMRYRDLNVYDLLRFDSVILTRDAFSDAVKRCERAVSKKSKSKEKVRG